jgi:hypothetical protein
LSRRICLRIRERPSGRGSDTHLGGHELGSSTEGACVGSIPHVFFAETVICDLDMSIKREKNVIELQIAIDHPILVEVLKRQTDLGRVKSTGESVRDMKK